jgi:plastocyanin
VDIIPGDLAEFNIEPVDIEVSAGTTVQFVATGYDAYKNQVTDMTLTWTSSGGGEVDTAGLYKPRQVGTWTVTASASGMSATANVNVIPGALSKFEVTPTSTTITAGNSLQFAVKGYDFYDNELPSGTLETTWMVDGGGDITDAGLFLAKWVGTWKLTASSSGKEAYATIIIKPGPPAKLIIEPVEYSMYVGESITFTVRSYDQYNNPVPASDVTLAWTESGGGEITDTGKFTADTPGSDWEVSASTGTDGTITTTAKINIEPTEDTDTDGDGIPDVWETKFGLDPLDPSDAEQDHEGDGADTLTEYQTGTNPRIEDTDGDGLPDGWELDYEFDPLEAIGVNGGEGDPDKDGYANLAEYQGGTDPLDGRDPLPEAGGAAKSDAGDKSEGLSGAAIAGILIAVIIAILIITMFLKRTGRLPKKFFGKTISPEDELTPGSPYDLINQTTPFGQPTMPPQLPQPQAPIQPQQPQQPPQWPAQPPQQLPPSYEQMGNAPYDEMQQINEQTTQAINNNMDDQYNQL